MIVLDEIEKKLCRIAIQLVETEVIVMDSTRSNDEVVTAEALGEELRQEWDDLSVVAEKELTNLKRRLVM